LGQAAVASLESIGELVDIVDVFRRMDALAEVADQAIRLRAKALWLQQGLWDEGVAARAKAAGLTVLMDNCIAVTLAALQISQLRKSPPQG
jgi:predicted CoA-binding protein